MTDPSSPVENALEEGTALTLDFTKLIQIGMADQQVVPVVLVDHESDEVLFVGYANDLALSATLERQQAVLWSTSRNELWHKGATSGDTLSLVEVRVNCEQNSLMYRVRVDGSGSCHTSNADGASRDGCYYRALDDTTTLRFV